ncbi:MAG: Crp/Fnr family transcriptional regulator [Candidatus Curtissbacteria bacterium]|nr:Crp/Fnr family transcriptional regulator [Candidatus Curtissbacteria bacterium]
MKRFEKKILSFDEFFLTGKQYRFKKGQLILRPDIIPTGLYYIEKGYVRVYYLTESGREKLHVIYKKDELFPLLLVLKKIHKDAYYEAMDEVVCRKIEAKVFLEQLSKNPHFSFALTQRLTDLLNVFINRLDNLETHGGPSRVIARLLFLAERFGLKTKDGILIEVPVTHKDIADSVALNRESVSRQIEDLLKRQIIEVKNHKFLIPKIRKLQKELLNQEDRY